MIVITIIGVIYIICGCAFVVIDGRTYRGLGNLPLTGHIRTMFILVFWLPYVIYVWNTEKYIK